MKYTTAFIKYLSYVLRHKWHVSVECFKSGLVWRGITHDLSKFLPDEFFPYMLYFYVDSKKYDKMFDIAWLKHQHRNAHHWQHWLLQKDSGNLVCIDIPKQYLIEMVCDWVGAGIAINGKADNSDKYFETKQWYVKFDVYNKYQMSLSNKEFIKNMIYETPKPFEGFRNV